MGNGIKLEIFIFDVFPLAEKVCVLEATRAEEFSPVKNKEGVDSPFSAKDIISGLHRQWLTDAGANVTGDGAVEVSPLVSYGGEGLEALAGKAVEVPVAGLYIDEAKFAE